MDCNLLRYADEYGVDYTLEQAVLVSRLKTIFDELESMIEDFQNSEMDYYSGMLICSGWHSFHDPCIPDEVLDILGDQAYSYLDDFLSLDYQYFFEAIDSGEVWNFKNIRSDIKTLVKSRSIKVEFDNYNHFTAYIDAPHASEVIDEDLIDLLIDLLDRQDFYTQVENINYAPTLIEKVQAHKSDLVSDVLKDLKCLDEFNYQYWENCFDCNSKTSLVQNIIKLTIDKIESMAALREQLQDLLRLYEKTYEALDTAVDCIADFLKGIEDTYTDPFYWLDFFEANEMTEAKEMRKILEKQIAEKAGLKRRKHKCTMI